MRDCSKCYYVNPEEAAHLHGYGFGFDHAWSDRKCYHNYGRRIIIPIAPDAKKYRIHQDSIDLYENWLGV